MFVEEPSKAVLIGSYRGFGEAKTGEFNPRATEVSRLLGEVQSGMLRIRSMIHEPEEAAEEPLLEAGGEHRSCDEKKACSLPRPEVLSGKYGQAKRPPSPLAVRYAVTQAELCKKAERVAQIESEELGSVFARIFRFFDGEISIRICSQIMFFRLFLELGLNRLAEMEFHIVSPFMSGTPDMQFLGQMCKKYSRVRAIAGVTDSLAPEETLFCKAEKVFVVASTAPDARVMKHIFGAILHGVEYITILMPQEINHRDMMAWQCAIPTFSHGHDGKKIHVEQFIF